MNSRYRALSNRAFRRPLNRAFGLRTARAILPGLALVAALLPGAPAHAGLRIIRTPIAGIDNGPPGTMVGGGNLDAIFNVAADYWEKCFPDPYQEWTVEFEYGWGRLSEGIADLSGQCTLITAGGNPIRMTKGAIRFDNSNLTLWFADPNPQSNSAFAHMAPAGSEWTIGDDLVFVNQGIWFVNPTNPDALDHLDLLTIAMHEIGHGLNLIHSPPEMPSPCAAVISAAVSPYYAGFEYAFWFQCEHLGDPALMMPRNEFSIRQFPSVFDILTIATLSGYNNPDWYPSLEIIVSGLEVPAGVKNSLQAKLQVSRGQRQAGNGTAARNILNAFVNQVRANPGGGLTEDQSTSLVSIAHVQIAGITEGAAEPELAGGTEATNQPTPNPFQNCGLLSVSMIPLTIMGFALLNRRVRARLHRAPQR